MAIKILSTGRFRRLTTTFCVFINLKEGERGGENEWESERLDWLNFQGLEERQSEEQKEGGRADAGKRIEQTEKTNTSGWAGKRGERSPTVFVLSK